MDIIPLKFLALQYKKLYFFYLQYYYVLNKRILQQNYHIFIKNILIIQLNNFLFTTKYKINYVSFAK